MAHSSTIFGHKNWVYYRPGSNNVVITAPHGGLLRPEELPNRSGKVCTDGDFLTEELATQLYEALIQLEIIPHLVVNMLDRIKVDQNRRIEEACLGHLETEEAYNGYHGFIADALAAAKRARSPALLLDIHGNSQREALVMLGYCVGAEQLRSGEFSLRRSTLMALKRRTSGSSHDFLRGDRSFGHFLQDAWLREEVVDSCLQPLEVVPSPKHPWPTCKGYKFFNGGHTVGKWCDGDALAIQVELSPDLRLPGPRQEACVRSLAAAVKRFSEEVANCKL